MATRTSVYEIKVEATGITQAKDQIIALSRPATSAAIAVNALRSAFSSIDTGALGSVTTLLKSFSSSTRTLARSGPPAGAAMSALAGPLRMLSGINTASIGRDINLLGRALPSIARAGFSAAAALNVMVPSLEALSRIPSVFIARDLMNIGGAATALSRSGFRGGASLNSLAQGLLAIGRVAINPQLGQTLISLAPGVAAMSAAVRGFSTRGGAGAATSINNLASALTHLNSVGVNPALTAQLTALGPVVANLNRNINALGAQNARVSRASAGQLSVWEQAFGRLDHKIGIVKDSLGFLRSALVVFASIGFVKQATDYIDSFTIMSNRVKIFTRDQNLTNAVLAELVNVSNETRTAILPNVELFGRMARAVNGMGKSYREVLDVVKLTSMAIQISGATTEEAQNAIIQFSQGLASGALRGDELRSVVEQMPRLSQAIADGLTTIGDKYPEIKKVVDTLRMPGVEKLPGTLKIAGGQLAAFAKKNPGILTTKFLFEAILASSGKMIDEFRQTTPTIGQAFTVLDNQLRVFLGLTSQATGAGRAFADMIFIVAKNVDLLFLALATMGTVLVFNFLTSQLAFFLATLTRGGATLLTFINVATLGFGRVALALALLPIAAVRAARTMISVFGVVGTTIQSVFGLLMVTALGALSTVLLSLRGVGSAFGLVGATITALRVAITGAVAGFMLMRAAGGTLFAVTTVLSSGFRAAASAAISLGVALLRGLLVFFMNPYVLGAAVVIGAIYAAFTYLSDEVKKLGGYFAFLKVIFNNVVAGIYAGVMTVWDGFSLLGPAVADIFVQLANSVLGTIQDMVNGIIDAINTVSQVANDITGVTALREKMGLTPENLINPVDLGKIETDYAGSAAKLGDIFSSNFKKAMDADPLQSILDSVKGVGSKVGDFMKGDAGLLGGIIGGNENFANMNTPKEDKNAAKKIEHYRKELRDLEESLSPVLALTNRLEQAQKTYNDAIAHGIAPRLAYQEAVKLIIRDELGVGNAAYDAAQKHKIFEQALRKGIVTLDEYNIGLLKVNQTALDTKRDLNSGALSGLIEIGDKVTNQAASMKGAVVGMFDKIRGGFAQNAFDVRALDVLYKNNIITTQEYGVQLQSLGQDFLDLKVQMGDASFAESFLAGVGKMAGGVSSFTSAAGAQFGTFFSSLSQGVGDSIGRAIVYSEDLGTALLDVARTALSELISALVQIGIQYLVNAAIGDAIQAAATAGSVAQAATVAAAWAPAAAMVSLASFGTNAIPAGLAIAGTTALASTLAAVAGGLADGGQVSGVGSGKSDSILKRLSNGEFVVNASATSRNLGLLNAVNDNAPASVLRGHVGSGVPESTAQRAFGGGRDGGMQRPVSEMGYSTQIVREQPVYNTNSSTFYFGDNHVHLDGVKTEGDPKKIAAQTAEILGPMMDSRIAKGIQNAHRGGGQSRNPKGMIRP